MKLEDFEAYIAAERERRKTPREREIGRLIAEIAMKHQQAYQTEIAPLVAELIDINNYKPPPPIRLGNGKAYEYVGPNPHT